MQGSVLAPLKTAVHIDTIGKECTQNNENMYMYKNIEPVPPLAFFDDVAAFSKCGQNTVKMNMFINPKIELKKLTLNEKKCNIVT